MKRVSFEIAKALKEAGYPQDENEELKMRGLPERVDVPTYIDTWLWLWREKGIKISHRIGVNITGIEDNDAIDDSFDDPEEAIIAAIESLVKNDLIK